MMLRWPSLAANPDVAKDAGDRRGFRTVYTGPNTPYGESLWPIPALGIGYGETKIMVANPGAKPSTNGRSYMTDRLSAVVEQKPCSDGMSDRRFADTVRVVADGKTLQGCGGKILPPDTLAGSNWTFVSIGGVAVAKDRPTALQFDGTRLSGSAGCNRFSGGYSVDGGTLKAAPLMATEMACPGAGMTQEAAFFKLMVSPVSLTFADDGTLILTGSAGRTAVLRRVI